MAINIKLNFVVPLLVSPALICSSTSFAQRCAQIHSEMGQVYQEWASREKINREIVIDQASTRDALLEKAQIYKRPDIVDAVDKILMIRDRTRDRSVRTVTADLLVAIDNFRDLRMQDFALKISESLSENTNLNQLKQIIVDAIPEIYTRKEAESMAEAFLTKKSRFNQLLPELTQEQVYKRVMGSKPGQIEPNSLMGRFLAEAKKLKGQPLAIERRAFYNAPRQRYFVPEKWFIPIDASLYPLYQKYFTGDHFLTHLHDHGQYTLFISYNNSAGSYARFDREPRMQSPNSLWPSILLSDAEANRMKMFVQVGRQENNLAQHPWNLGGRDAKTNKHIRYVEEGYFKCCTHWFGNIPLGESRVDRYIFPGNDPRSIRDADPVITQFGPNSRARIVPNVYSGTNFFNQRTRTPKEYSRMVWTTPGHMQLWEVLGLKNSQITGELANPGFVAFALITKTTENRVPFVFVTVEDATSPLPTNKQMKDERWIEVD